MKISPVQGTPTIQPPSSTGLSPDKIERLKQIAAGKSPEEKETVQLGEIPTPATNKITMNTNRTVLRDGDSIPTAEPQGTEITTEKPVIDAQGDAQIGIPDTNVETTPAAGTAQPISPQLAQLARQKRALQVKEREILEKEKSLQTQNQGRQDLEERLKASPLSVLQELGVTYEQLTNEILGKQGNHELDSLKSEFKTLQKSIDEKLAEKDKAQEVAVYDHIKRTIDKLSFASNDFKLIRESKSQGDVLELIKRTWEEQGEVLDEEDAMKAIEAELREDARRYAKLLEDESVAVTAAPVEKAAPKQQSKTLTNKDSARPSVSRRQRAIAAMLGQK